MFTSGVFPRFSKSVKFGVCASPFISAPAFVLFEFGQFDTLYCDFFSDLYQSKGCCHEF